MFTLVPPLSAVTMSAVLTLAGLPVSLKLGALPVLVVVVLVMVT